MNLLQTKIYTNPGKGILLLANIISGLRVQIFVQGGEAVFR